MNEEILPFPKLQRLRVPAGWEVARNHFYDLEPKGKLLVYDNPNNNGWLLFEQDLLLCVYKKQDILLDIGWVTYYDPNGRFISILTKNEDWHNRQTICETRSKAEIVAAIEQTMLQISQDNGDYNVEAKGIALQPLRFNSNRWVAVKNEFFEPLNPNGEMRVEGLPNNDAWQFMTEEMLLLQCDDNKIKLGWFPAHDPNGAYRIIATTEKYFEPPLVDYSTRDKAEVVDIIEHLMKEIHRLKPNR